MKFRLSLFFAALISCTVFASNSVYTSRVEDAHGELTFVSPKEKGEYRLFSYVFDGKNKVGYANTPFYIK